MRQSSATSSDLGGTAVRLSDLLVAPTAEIHGAVVARYDRDFDNISAVTVQPVECIVPARSVP